MGSQLCNGEPVCVRWRGRGPGLGRRVSPPQFKQGQTLCVDLVCGLVHAKGRWGQEVWPVSVEQLDCSRDAGGTAHLHKVPILAAGFMGVWMDDLDLA